jgi:hypothetical protein
MDLQNVLLNLQGRLLDLESENNALAGELVKLKEVEQNARNLTFSKGVYWKGPEEGRRAEGPYCPNCWDMDRKLIRLNSQDEDLFQCAFHKTLFHMGDS